MVKYIFECYVYKMINLVNLEINVGSGSIDNEMVGRIGGGLGELWNLKKLELNLENNYIDNFGFGIMLENLELINQVIIDVVLNNIVKANEYNL